MANPNIKEFAHLGNAKTPIGKFRRDLGKFSREWVAKHDPELLSLFDWYKSMNTNQINQILELKNLSNLLKDVTVPTIFQKIVNHQELSKRELDTLRLFMEVNVNTHRMEFGDKHTVEHQVTYEDVRKQIFSDKKIINAEVLSKNDLRQNLDRSGSNAGTGRKKENGQNVAGSPTSSESQVRA